MTQKDSIKAGILTFHRADNYGALLQALALQRVLLEKGIETEIIDYRCEAIEKVYRYRLFPQFRLNFIKWGQQFRDNCYTVPKLNIKKAKCERFREKYLKLSTSVYTSDDRFNIERQYDLIITGSDQIWNPKITYGKDDWYAFKRKSDNELTLVSYGASLGNLGYFEEYFKFYVQDLNRYDYISVREQQTKAFLQDALTIPVFKVLDPTLLASKQLWDIITFPYNDTQDAYIFYYDVDYNETCEKLARKLAADNNLKIIHFNTNIVGNNTVSAKDAGPEEFLCFIKNATCIVTSSFHATVFSILFEKMFFTVPHPKTGARVRDLLADLSLTHRLIEPSDECVNIQLEHIDYSVPKSILDKLRMESMAYLDLCINAANNK